MRKFLSLVAAILPIIVSITVFTYTTGILDSNSLENTRLGNILGIQTSNKTDNFPRNNSFLAFVEGISNNLKSKISESSQKFIKDNNVLQSSSSSTQAIIQSQSNEILSPDQYTPLYTLASKIVTYENIKDATDGVNLLDDYLNVKSEAENEVRSINMFISKQRFDKFSGKYLEISREINFWNSNLRRNLSFKNTGARIYFDNLPLIQMADTSLSSNTGKVPVFETDASGRLMLRGQDNIAIGGTLGVYGEFSAGSGSITNAFGVGTHFSAASGSITNNFGIGGNLGVANAFSAATGVFSGNFSAASGNISNDFSIGGNLTALSGSITNNFGIGGNLGVANAFSAATGVFSGNFSAASGNISNDFSIGGNLGVIGAFSAGSGVFGGNLTALSGSITNAFGVGTHFSAASGNISNNFSIGGNLTALSGSITNNFGIGGNLGVASAFSAASGNISNNFSIGGNLTALSGNISNDFSIGGNLTALSGVISGNFSAGNSSLSALTVRGGLITITSASPTLQLGNANFLGSLSFNSSNQMVLDTNEGAGGNGQIQFRVAGNSGAGTNPTIDVVISRGMFSTAGQISVGSLGAGASTTLCHNNNIISTCSSLREFKTNIKNMDNALTDIKKLRPVVYNWKGDGKKDLGFIAEEVVDVNPIYGEYGGQNGELTGVKYMHLTSLLTKGIQEQQYTIELMKEVDKNQEEKLDTLDTSLSDKYNTLENDVKNYDQKFADIDDKLKKLEDFESKLDSLKVSDFENLIATLTNSLEALSMSTEEGSLTINSGLTVTGDTLFNNANFTGDVKFGNIKINTLENSINVLGAECVADTAGNCETNKLSIMSNKAGIIDIFSGVITLTPQGNITATRIEVNEVVSKEVIAENIQVTGFGNPLKNETCKAGEMKFGNKSEEGVEEQESFMYVCVSDNTWKRSSLNSY